MNQKVFKEAHRITRETLKSQKGDYRATLSIALKMLYKAIEEKKASILNEAKWQKEKFPAIFKASIAEMAKPKLQNPFLVQDVATTIIKNIPENRKASQELSSKEEAYYKNIGGRVTMC